MTELQETDLLLNTIIYHNNLTPPLCDSWMRFYFKVYSIVLFIYILF